MPIHSNSLPTHIAVIMDGNGRWAASRDLPRSEGHRAGTEAVRTLITECRTIGIRYLTLYTFSRENWSRPADEVGFLFDLLVRFLREELPELMRRDIRLCLLGEEKDLPFAARSALQHACRKTGANRSMTVNLALNYSGREEIARAARLLARESGPDAITADRIGDYLYTAGQPDPDLIIRTSGEMRISNFLLYQAAYSEFVFTPTLWPDFSAKDLHQALAEYEGRDRRFGKAGDSS